MQQTTANKLAAEQRINSALFGLEPEALWKHFDALTRIPRPSKKEGRVREYVMGRAGRLGLEVVEDHAGNLKKFAAVQAVINFAQAQANRCGDTAAWFQALGGGWWRRRRSQELRQASFSGSHCEALVRLATLIQAA